MLPREFSCLTCRSIARELRQAWHADIKELRGRLQSVARSSGRDLRTVGAGWVRSISEMPDDEMETLLRSHHPRVAEVRVRKEKHEADTGHSILLHGWWVSAAYGSGLEEEE